MADEVAVDIAIRGKPQPRGIDGEIAALAGRQYGVVARRQVLALGLGPGAIDRRLARGRLHLLHRGVYAVGHRVVSREGRWMAAVLAVGPEAVLSHRSAAALWRMRPPAGGHIEVTVPGPRRSRPALKVHHSTLAADEVTVLRAIPVTTPARTLLDLAAVLDARQLRRAIDETEVQRLTDTTPLGDLTERHPRRRGAAALRRILATRTIGATITRSELETRFLEFLDEAVLPRPRSTRACNWDTNASKPTASGPSSTSSPSSTATPATPRPRDSNETGRGTARCRRRVGGSSASPGASSTTRPPPSPETWSDCSKRGE